MQTIAEEVEAILDLKVHEDLCSCPGFPELCSTYGKIIPWNHSDVEEIVKITLQVQQERLKRDKKALTPEEIKLKRDLKSAGFKRN